MNLQLTDLTNKLIELLFQLVFAAISFFILYGITRVAQRTVARLVRRSRSEVAEPLSLALSRIIGVGGIVLAISVALAVMGLNLTALMAGLGLTSVALGFALKDTIEQAITGTLLLIQRPFKIGDLIEVENVEGVVVDIAIRTTNLRTADGIHVLVPNNKVWQGVVRNKSYFPGRRFTLTLGINYENDLPATHRALLKAVRDTPGVLADPEPVVSFDAFDAATIRTVIRYWAGSAHNTFETIADLQNAVSRSVIDQARADNIRMPIPIQLPPATDAA